MSNLTDSRDLYTVEVNTETKTIKATWMNRIYRDGVEIDAAREAEVKSYAEADKEDFEADVEGAASYVAAVGWA